ncbi:maltase 2-like [Sitophilus oryzae]|uniref:alpha-glucosidase n=1 Tax=Sitophilus oryzae TaxID=7048 RepID=A0A6J2YXP9_SITOR|nr:maltase 2-like [Sitophilus oryzae]
MCNTRHKMKSLQCLMFAVFCSVAFGDTVVLTNTGKEDGSNLKLFTEWWETSVFYQIYPRSFKDSDNDGSGDLQGIIQKLDHIQDAGIDAVWLSPIYKSPQVDNGYDISDYRDVDEIYGTLDDLKQLLDEAHKRGIKVILDYVPNHTSDQHAWFQASLKNDSVYADYYVWKDAVIVNGTRTPPNNWLSEFKGSAWEWSEERQQYYLHQFSVAQPDLNYRNPAVVNELKDVLTYWLDFGVDGFRMDAVFALFEDAQFRDEPPSGDTNSGPEDYGYLKHIYTADQHETLQLIYDFRDLLDKYSANLSYPRIMMTEVYSDIATTMLYYGTYSGSRKGAHFTFNFWSFILGLQKGFTSTQLWGSIYNWFNYIPAQYTPNWVLGNHDQSRVSTRLGPENVDALNILISILPGVQVTYNGEEIGQENGEVTCEQGYDPQAIKNCSTFNQTSRDFERTPFQWDSTVNAGFNEGAEPWLPVSQKYLETNLESQNVTGINSHYNIYKQTLQLRQSFRNETGYFVLLSSYANLFVAERILSSNNDDYVLYYNVGDEAVTPSKYIAEANATVVIRSSNSAYNIGDLFNYNGTLLAREAVLVRLDK